MPTAIVELAMGFEEGFLLRSDAGAIWQVKVDRLHTGRVVAAEQLPMPEPATRIACARHQSLAIGVSGQVYSWGDERASNDWLLGHGGVEPEAAPRLIEAAALAERCACHVSAGTAHNVVTTRDGKAVVWGNKKFLHSTYWSCFGHEGFGEYPTVASASPLDTEFLIHATCGDMMTLALTAQGDVLIWGKAEHGGKIGVLGLGPHVSACGPTIIPGLPKVVAIYADPQGSNACFVTANGALYGFGLNVQANLGWYRGQFPDSLGRTKTGVIPCSMVSKPVLIEEVASLSPLAVVAPSEKSTAVLSIDGSLWVLGDRGTPKKKEEGQPLPPQLQGRRFSWDAVACRAEYWHDTSARRVPLDVQAAADVVRVAVKVDEARIQAQRDKEEDCCCGEDGVCGALCAPLRTICLLPVALVSSIFYVDVWDSDR
jgi:hypothetical protein